MIAIIGRGRGGTRLPGHLLLENGVATGNVNYALDMMPPRHMYMAADLYSQYVKYNGDCSWDFSKANEIEVPEEFTQSMDLYLSQVRDLPEPKFFKIPEAILCYPWLREVFPQWSYVHWVRDPRDASRHHSDRMEFWDYWGIDRAALDEEAGARAVEGGPVRDAPPSVIQAMSWKYQYDIVKCVPAPERFITMRYEDFCLSQEQEVARLGEFLGMELKPLPEAELRPDAVYKWTRENDHRTYDFLEPAIKELGYDRLPAAFR